VLSPRAQAFWQIAARNTVIAELRHEDSPATVRSWASNLPPWVSVEENPQFASVGLEKLQAGERAAILTFFYSTKRRRDELRQIEACGSPEYRAFWVRLLLGAWLNSRQRSIASE
jgi:hypothetical protein